MPDIIGGGSIGGPLSFGNEPPQVAQLGRISGKLLNSNLLRDGVDLAFETDLLYLDVNNDKIGINKNPTTYDLEINSSSKAKNLTTSNLIPVDDLRINTDNSITSLVNPIEVFADGDIIFHDRMITENLIFDDNRITTVTNGDIVLDPNGTGSVLFFSDVSLAGNIDVVGNITLGGNLRVDGTITLGDSLLDLVILTPDLSKELIPSVNDTYDIGTSSLRYNNIRLTDADSDTSITVPNFTISTNPSTISVDSGDITFIFPAGDTSVTIDKLVIDSLTFKDNLISGLETNIVFDPNGSGEINLEADTNISGNLQTSTSLDTNDLTVNSNVIFGDNSSDTITLSSEIIGSLIPSIDSTYNLGDNTNAFRQIYVTTVTIDGSYIVGNFTVTNDPSAITVSTGDIIFELSGNDTSINFDSIIADNNIKIEGNLISSIETNADIMFNPNGTGEINLQSNTNIYDDITVSNTIEISNNINVGNNSIFGADQNNLLTFNSSLVNSILPDITEIRNIGSPDKSWKDFYLENNLFSSEIDTGNFSIDSNNITSNTGSIEFTWTDNSNTIYLNQPLDIGNHLRFDNTFIKGLSGNENIVFSTNGSGEINFLADTNITGDLDSVDVTALSDGSVDGSSILGNDITDTLEINSKISNTLSPLLDSTYDLGELSNKFNYVYVNNLSADVSISAGNITIANNPSSISASSGDINFVFTGTATFTGIILNDTFKFEGNLIQGLGTNANVRFSTSGTGDINLAADTNIYGDLYISGNTELDGNLSTASNLIIGDQLADTVTVAPDLTQSIIPGVTNIYDLGRAADDSSPRFWNEAYIRNNTNIGSIVVNESITISDQMIINGITNTISTIQSNENLQLSPATGKTNIDGDISIGTAQVPLSTLTTIDNPDSDGSPIGDGFGQKVDASASYFIVSARGEDTAPGGGQAHVYSAITGALIQTLTNPNAFGTGANDNYGWDLAISESYAVVSAPGEDDPSSSGRVYVYSTADWSLLHTLTNPNTYGTPSSEGFGEAVEVSESYVIIGARDEDDVGGFAVGRAYIYDAATGTLLHTLNNPTGTAGDQFGLSVAITDTHAVVGAPGYSSGQGRVYVYNPATGSLLYTIANPLGGGYYRFGASVDVSDSWIIVGLPEDGPGGGSGSVYIFETSSGGQIFYITNPNAYGTTIEDYFGESVGITESYAIVGAALEDAVGETNTGKVYIFSTVDASLLQTVNNPNPDGVSLITNQDLFGWDVAINELSAVIGTFAEDDGADSQGKAYFLLPAGGDTSQGIITNLTNNALTLAATGNGYYQFQGTNGMVIPIGDDTTRPGSPELGDTRYNTDQEELEVFNGTEYKPAAGDTADVVIADVEESAFINSLILG